LTESDFSKLVEFEPMISLNIEPAKPVLVARPDGSGYDVRREGEHRACLHIGNVALAFDGRNNFVGHDDLNLDRERIELSEYRDCPVRLNGVDCKIGTDSSVSLLFALASDLGYILQPKG
jgi:hypothetical protein